MTKKIVAVMVVLTIFVGIYILDHAKTDAGEANSFPEERSDSITPESTPSDPDLAAIPKVRTKDYAAKSSRYPTAIELVDPEGYLNTDSITIGGNIGRKVILVDFWTYSCINCQRTTPYLNDWHEKYHDKGLVIIGVHTPEFDFEKEYANVQKAIEKFGIKYPVVQDNDYQTWRAYGNRYWPRKYLIDIDGFIVYDHIGEGAYKETEMKIQELLNERAEAMKTGEKIEEDLAAPVDAGNLRQIGTPEIYFGYAFSRNQMGNKEGWQPEKIVEYSLPSEMEDNKFYLSGTWRNSHDGMRSISEGKIILTYKAKLINIVAGAAEPSEITVSVDGKEMKQTISDHTLYALYEDDDYSEKTIEISVPEGVTAYTFTFG